MYWVLLTLRFFKRNESRLFWNVFILYWHWAGVTRAGVAFDLPPSPRAPPGNRPQACPRSVNQGGCNKLEVTDNYRGRRWLICWHLGVSQPVCLFCRSVFRSGSFILGSQTISQVRRWPTFVCLARRVHLDSHLFRAHVCFFAPRRSSFAACAGDAVHPACVEALIGCWSSSRHSRDRQPGVHVSASTYRAQGALDFKRIRFACPVSNRSG